jgi:hypothetical protein
MHPEFIQRTLALLHGVERHASTPEEHDALANSRHVLHFIRERNEAGEFEASLNRFSTGPRSPALSFTTKEDAEAWLQAHPAPPHGALMKAGEALYQVAYSRELGSRKLLPLPPQEEWARMEASEEEADEEPRTLNPSHDTRFNVFDLFEKTCLHLHELEQRMSSPEELDALRTAKLAFHFVMNVGESLGLEAYLETLEASMSSPPVLSFATRQEADSWLAQQPEPPPPAVVAIGSGLYSVGYNRRRGGRVLLRIPTQ